jgi:hypothetical protein
VAVGDLVLLNFAAEGVAVNSQRASGAALISFGLFHGALDKAALEFGEGFFEKNPAIYHLSDKSF